MYSDYFRNLSLSVLPCVHDVTIGITEFLFKGRLLTNCHCQKLVIFPYIHCPAFFIYNFLYTRSLMHRNRISRTHFSFYIMKWHLIEYCDVGEDVISSVIYNNEFKQYLVLKG